MPRHVPDEELEYEVTCSVNTFESRKFPKLLRAAFYVKMQPADAVSWFVHTTADSIVSGDEEDFARVVRGMPSLFLL